nr:TPA_asm: ATP8 [Bombus bohemicus]
MPQTKPTYWSMIFFMYLMSMMTMMTLMNSFLIISKFKNNLKKKIKKWKWLW